MNDADIWVFGYGSLMWHPGFAYVEKHIATLPGYWRSFCMRSIHHRGTEDRPGLVLALDEHDGSECHGLAFRLCPDSQTQSMAELRERELVSYAYLEKRLPVALADGRQVDSITYVIDPAHRQYSGGLGLEDQAQIIAVARGGRGDNADYLYNTATHLAELGLEDDDLTWLAGRVRDIRSGKG